MDRSLRRVVSSVSFVVACSLTSDLVDLVVSVVILLLI